MMHTEGSFPRLVELIQADGIQEDTSLHQMLLELLYESSRVQRLDWEDFGTFCGFAIHHSIQIVADTFISRRERQLYTLSSRDYRRRL